jgi:pyruvate kinase
MAASYQPRHRNVRIVATLGPASREPATIEALYKAGADVFRVNMSHGTQADRKQIIEAIRGVEQHVGRPIAILVDLQGPKLRVGTFADGPVTLKAGQAFRFDLDPKPGDTTRVHLPHREVFAALRPGATLLVDDGKLRFTVTTVVGEVIETKVAVGGKLSNHKGVNVPDVVIPMAALTEKDRSDLAFALDMGVDWVALSFVQKPEDVAEARKLIGNRAGLLAKIEKPSAVEFLGEILEQADAVMVARGDLGVELPPEAVPPIQKRIVAAARAAGKPVVVATQMLESMITAPTPTRAEVSDVANAIYDGADAVMLSAESAAGQYPIEAVTMMDRIAHTIEADPGFAAQMAFADTRPEATAQDAVSGAAASVARVLGASAILCYTTSGSTARRTARERPGVPVVVLTPRGDTARRLCLTWGLHAVRTRDVESLEEMIGKAKRMALRTRIARGGDSIVVTAGYPFGTPGSTNLLHIAWLRGDELAHAKKG